VINQAAHVHELAEVQRAVPSLTLTPLDDPPGLRLAGEVDVSSWSALEGALRSLPAGAGDLHLELAQLSFIDAHGATTLVRAAERLGTGRSLVLHNPPSVLRRLLELLWPDVETIKMDTP
jgi:ABC-type transporter Mla MlaB component